MAALPEAAAPEAAVATRARVRPSRRAGWRVVAAKEFSDGIMSIRLFILIALLGLAAVAAIYSTATYVSGNAQAATGSTGLFVQLFSNQPSS